MQKGNWETEVEWDSDQEESWNRSDILSNNEPHIQEVWAGNFHEEMKKLTRLVERYPVIAMVRAGLPRTQSFRASLLLGVRWTSDTILNRSASTSL